MIHLLRNLDISILLLCLSTSIQAQTVEHFKTVTDTIPVVISVDSVNPSTLVQKNSLPNLVFDEYWDTTTYNPYKKVKKVYPIHLVFTDSIYTAPMDRKKVITSRYGWRNRRAHKGIDIDLVTGDNVKVMFDGIVRYVNYHSGHGKTVVVRHVNGLETSYSHLSKQLVKANDTVSKGQVIGKGGTTGNARGSHLHLEVSYKGIYIHPEYLFEFGAENRIRSQDIWITKNWTTPFLHNSKRKSTLSLYTSYEEAIESEKKQRHIYVVQRGDTLSKISQKYQVSITSLCKTNAIKKTSTLRIGQKLVLIK